MSSFTGVIMSFILCRPGGALPNSKYTFGSIAWQGGIYSVVGG